MSKILIVEDEEQILNLEKDYLELSGYSVEVARDGNTGLNMALTGDADLVILDIMLPGMSGLDICSRIREYSEVPIIIVSAKREDADKVKGLGHGANDYMIKPFSPSEMVARVKAQLERYKRVREVMETQGHDRIESRGLQIDKIARRVFVDGAEKNLTTKEFDLLFFLASHPNRVFTKEELLENVWESDPDDSDPATVTVHVRKVREKIESNPQKPKYIETVWSVGYRFIES